MFRVEFAIDENDYLTHYLYTASKSKSIVKRRLRNKWIIPVLYIVLGGLIYTDNSSLAIIFFMVAVLWFLFYPLWERHRFITQYRNHIRENYKGKLGRVASIEFYDDSIIAKDESGETKVFTAEIETINEIPTTIFVKFKSGNTLILSKPKIENLEELIKSLKELSIKINKPYLEEFKWTWK